MKIIGVETYPVSIPVDPELAIVSSAGEHRVSHYVIVVIRSDEELCGIGEANVVPAWSGELQAGAMAAFCRPFW